VASFLERFEAWAREQVAQKAPWEIDAVSAQAEVEAFGRRVLNLAGDDALGLSGDARVKEAAQSALRKYGTAPLPGVRVVRELEEAYAHQLGLKAAVASSSAADLWRLLLGQADRVLVDGRTRLTMRSVLGGTGAAIASVDDLEVVKQLPTAQAALWVSVATYPFEGDVASLAGPAEAARTVNATWLVDESHGIGVLGKAGTGALDHQRLQGAAAVVFTRLDTALASSGAMVAGPKALVDCLRAELSEQALLSAPFAAAAHKSLEIIGREPARRARLFDVAERLNKGLGELGFDTGPSVTPRIPLWVGDSVRAHRFARELRESGVWLRVAYGGGPWLVATPSATLSDAQIEQLLETVARTTKKLMLSPAARSSERAPLTLARPDVQVCARPAEAHWFPAAVADEALEEEGGAETEASPVDWKHRVFDGLERLTWRATNMRSQELRAVFQKSRTLRAFIAPRRKG
jgi:7-keto-8-aminopelargonate synthetase-like enzyme